MRNICFERWTGTKSLSGFSLIEIIVVIAVCLVLAVLIVNFQVRAVETAHTVTCSRNLREIYVLMAQYLKDHNNQYPAAATETRDEHGNLVSRIFWAQEIATYTGITVADGAGQPFVCPATKDANPGLMGRKGPYGSVFAYVTYAINRYGISPGLTDSSLPAVASSIENPAHTLLAVDWDSKSQPWEGWYLVSRSEMDKDWDYITERHSGKVNALYCDGHVKTHADKEQFLGSSRRDAPWKELKYTSR